MRLACAALLAVLLLATPAAASVHVEVIPKRLDCGEAITPGIWAEPGTTGNRRVRMRAIDQRTGRVWWRKRANAWTTRWRWWYLPAGMDNRCAPTTIEYRWRQWRAVYKVRFR